MTISTETQKANRRLWIEALRSGKYVQGKFRLKDRTGAMCCLGVLCDVAGLAWMVSPDGGFAADGNGVYAPWRATEFVGLSDEGGTFFVGGSRTELADLNDEQGWSFAEIADLIESEPDGLFPQKVEASE